jgi:cholest-4-en-3-one 26-monooxygenase
MENREQMGLLLDDPPGPGRRRRAPVLLPSVRPFPRTATRDVELQGKTIREGDKVLLWYVSSNRDETVYDDPQRLDVCNPDHQAFGAGGRHFCLGAALARLGSRPSWLRPSAASRTSSWPASPRRRARYS